MINYVTERSSMVQYDKVRTVPFNTEQYYDELYSTIKYGSKRLSPVQYDKVRYRTNDYTNQEQANNMIKRKNYNNSRNSNNRNNQNLVDVKTTENAINY